ncbi:hypothetical protein MBR_10470, partial [Metarhizium brunneum ARSEF 3297]
MVVENFTTVNRRIEEERRAKYCGTASISIASLQYRDPADDGATGSKNNHVDAIKRMFRQERGCRKEDSRHHVKALIPQQVLEAAVARASIPSSSLMRDALPYPELEFPTGVKIECLEGHDRLAAADKVLQGSKKRWTVDLYLDDLSDDLRLLLTDGYDYQKAPDDGEYYVTIRQFQGHGGEKNPFFENLWLGRLATNANKKRLFNQLSKHKEYGPAFDTLLAIPGLFGSFRLGTIHQLIGMKCDEPNLAYLNHIYRWWRDVCDGDQEAMKQITRGTITALEGKAPGACSADHRILSPQVRSGEIFENFSPPQREAIWSRVCSSSRQCLIPSLFTFFEDRKLLNDAAGCIKKILHVGPDDTVTGVLNQRFTNANQREDQCIIQLSETTFTSVAGDINTRLDLGIRQLWLAAFRNYKELPADTQKKDLLAVSRTKANETVLHELASLAARLGFVSDQLEEILETSSDRKVAEQALFAARQPGRYMFRDPEACIQQIVDAFAAAVPASESKALLETEDEVREHERPPQRCGRPNDTDYRYDKTRLFLPQMHADVYSEMREMTSTFVRRSVYCAYFGAPPPLGSPVTSDDASRNDDVAMIPCMPISEQPELLGNSSRPTTVTEEDVILAITRHELHLEQARHSDISRRVRDKESKLEELTQDEASLQERLDEINRQILDRNVQLDGLRQDVILEEKKLTRLKTMVHLEQSKLDHGQREVAEVISEEHGEPAPESPAGAADGSRQVLSAGLGQGAETQIVLRRTDRNTRFNFQELVAHDPNKEHQEALAIVAEEAGADGAERKRTIRIDFVDVESGDSFVISDPLIVDPANPDDLERIGDKRDLKSLCEASKALYVLAAAHLYGTHEVLLRAPDEHYLDEVEVEGLLRAAERSSDLLARVTNLRISAPFSERLRLRCVHDDVDDEEVHMTMDHDDNGQDRSSLQLLGSRILPILQKLQDGRLQKSSWDMGVCVPQQLLGQGGYVLTHQNRIQHLRLVTDANCALNSQSPALALQGLKSLKYISWTGLRTYSDFIALGLALRQNAHHLEALQLDFIDWELVKEHWDEMDDDIADFFRFILRVRPQSTKLRFPAMENLSLSGLDLTSHSCGVAYAVNTASLRSITIRRCPGWELFLQRLIEPNYALNITSLEIYQPVGLMAVAENEEEVLRNFLESISGLESLYLSLPSPTDTKALWRTAVRHKATLRRFIYHARSVNLDDESELFEEEMDLNDMALLSDSFLAHLRSQSPNPLGELYLECIGLACDPRRLKEVIEPLSHKGSLQVLHIRQSGPDIRKYGSLVFSQI